MDRLECDRMFVLVADQGSFAEAARRLGVSSGQASKLVSALERDLGVQLLKRTTRALALTEVGHAYHLRMKALLEEFDALDASVRQIAGTPSGRLRLTAPLSFGKSRIVPLLLDFARAFPAIRLDVDLSDAVRNIVDDGFDLAIRIGIPADSSLIARKLCDMEVLLVASPAYLDLHGVPERPADLADHACIIDANFRDPLHWPLRAASGDGAPPVRVAVREAMRMTDGDACLDAAEAGFGIARVPDFIASRSLAAGRVRRVLPGWLSGAAGIHAIYPPARHLAFKVRTLVDFLAVSLRPDGRAEPGAAER